MQPSRGKSRDPGYGGEDQQLNRGLSQAWSQLGKARKELRRMEHRIGDAHTATESGAALAGGTGASSGVRGSNPSGIVIGHTYHLNTHSPPTARFVNSASPSRVSSQSSSAKRKVSRLDDKEPATSKQRQRRSERAVGVRSAKEDGGRRTRHAKNSADNPPYTATTNPDSLADPQPKRVDFSQRLRLREVKWDGTYRDSVSHPPPNRPHPHPSYPSYPSTLSNSELDTAELQGTLTDSRAIRETEIRFLNDTYVAEAFRGRLEDDPLSSSSSSPLHQPHPHHHRKHKAQPRLTHVDLDIVGGSRSRERGQGHAEGRRRVSGNSAPSYNGVPLLPPGKGGGGGGGEMSDGSERVGGDMGDSSGGEHERGAVGGAPPPSRGLSARQQKKIKRSLKDLPQDDNILSQLREKIRQQRLSASDNSSQNDSSLASSHPSSESSRDPGGAQRTLHDAHDPVRRGDDGTITPDKMPLTRKVAAGPPVPTYKGFSEPHLDPHLQKTVKQIDRLITSRRRNPATHKSEDPIQSALQAQIRAHHPASIASSVVPASTSTPNSKTAEKAAKAQRVVATGKRPSKPGAKNLITTSSWRAGQELIARELGLQPKSKNKEESRKVSHEEPRRPDGAEGTTTHSSRVPAAGAAASASASGRDYSSQLAQSRALSDDAKKLFSDLQLDNGDRVPARPAVKRKAPKAEREDKPHQLEKQRHYDSDSVRQFMAKQKAQRQRQKDDARKAEEQEHQKRQKLMQELITKQKSAVAPTTVTTTATAVSKPKKIKRAGRAKQRVLFPGDQQSYDLRIRALLGGDSDKENSEMMRQMEVDDDSDADTLTGESEAGSTPRATPAGPREDATARPHNMEDQSNVRPHNDHRLDTTTTLTAPITTTNPHSLPTSVPPPGGSTIEFQGKKLNLDVNTVLSRFSQVLNQRQGGGGTPGVEGGAVGGTGAGLSASERSRQDRLQALKSSAKTLQNKIATATTEINHRPDAHLKDAGDSSPEVEFVPRYDRIAGSRDDYNVFTANLPGAQNVTVRPASNDKTPAAGARTVSQSQRDSVSAALPRAGALTVTGLNQPDDEDDSVTETSTFSEVTAADDWAAQTPKRKPEAGRNGTTQAPETGTFSGVQYRAPAPGPSLRWENPHSDPYSVLNVFSRNQQYVKAPGRPDRQSARDRDTHSQSHSAQLKDPKMTSSQQVVFGQTLEGHPMMTRTTYTRVEATLQDRSQASQPSASGRARATRSEDRSERLHQHSFPSRHRSTSDDTLESDDDVTPKAVSSRQTTKKSAIGFRRQVSDTGQETDVSQLSEDEPRVSLRNYDRPIVVDTTQDEPADARWSPAALERQMAAELARLESLEDSIRQLSSAERTRAVALAQQETVSVAQVLKARQQEHSAELRTLQLQVQEERLASAQQLQQQLNMSKGVQAPASDMSLLSSIQANRQPGNRTLLVPAENRRPDTKATSPSPRSGGRDDTEYSETFTKSASSVSPSRSAVTRSPTTRSKTSSVKTAEDSATSIVKTAEDSIESVKTAEDSDASIKTASDADRHSPDVSAAPEEVPDGDYSLSFDESMTEDESFRQAAGNRRDTRRQKSSRALTEDGTSYRVNDLTSVFGGEDSFNRFTIDIVRNIMREEEMRAQHQESLLRIRVKALKEKTKTQLSLLEQERQRLKGKEKEEGVQRDLKRLADKEKFIRKEQEEHQAEIDRMFKTEELAREHRQSLLKQHEQIAKMQNETREKMKQLQGRLGRPADVHTEDETSMMEDLSDASDVSYAKDSKSDTEIMQRKSKAKGDKQKMEKQQKLRLDQKYLTVREQKLMERKKQASELLRWKRDLDAEEEKVLQLERTALQVWEARAAGKSGAGSGDKQKETENKVKAPGNLRPEPSARAAEPITPRTARSDSAVTPRSARDSSYTPFSQSEPVSTHISASEKRTASDSSGRSRAPRTRSSQASESSVPEDIPDGGSESNQRSSPGEKRHDSSDDTIVNSSVNEEEEEPAKGRKGKRSPVGRLLPPGNSPLPQPWSRRTGSESESEESMSHTETLSDVSDYEVRIRQLSDMLRRRRKEADMLKKERSRRQKEKLRAQEESLKKQVEAYEVYINQVKTEQADLEREGGKPTVPPKIKQPHASKSKTSPSSSPSPSHRNPPDDVNYSSSDSNQTSPALSDSRDSRVSPLADRANKKKTTTPTSSALMDRISEGSESLSERSRQDTKKGRTDNKPSLANSISEDVSVSEAIEEAADSASASVSEPSRSAIMNIKTSEATKADQENKTASIMDDASYTQEFSDTASKSLAKSHSKIPVSLRSDLSQGSAKGAAPKSEVSEVIESAVSTAKSDSSAAPKFDLKATTPAAGKDLSAGSGSSRPATGIQESDSESESRINSHRTLSRPSSERSTGSTTYSDLHDFDEEEEDIISSESDRTPVRANSSPKEKSAAATRTEEDISEHISVSLPSISEKKSGSQATGLGQLNSIDAALGDLLGEEDATPTHTPRAESPPFDQEESPDPLLMTDPLADYHEGDTVLVSGQKGTLRFKGPVSFAPGFWAGVELNAAQGDTDGQRDGKRYFSCPPDHGVLVPGSEISVVEEEEREDVKSPDESLTDQDEVSSATEGERSRSAKDDVHARQEEAVLSSPLKLKTPPAGRKNLDLLADDITADLTKSLMDDSVLTMNSIASRHSPPHSPPGKKTPPQTLPKPKMPQEREETKRDSQKVENTTSSVAGGLLNDAISTMMQIRQNRKETGDRRDSPLVNGYSDNDSGVDPSHDSSMEPAVGVSPEPESGVEAEEPRRQMSPEPFQRPKSPVPVNSSPLQEEHDDDYDFSGLMEDDQEFFDDDAFGLSGKPPPPYPGAGDQTKGGRGRSGSGPASPVSKPSAPADLFIIPHERAEVEAIISDAVEVYWNLRRCGEPWETATPPPIYLSATGSQGGAAGEEVMEGMVSASRRTFKHLVFDLTGEIVRDIYSHEDDTEPPAWQKPSAKRTRYFKGHKPPNTKDDLMPVVQSTVTDILGLNGSSGRYRGKVANKWLVRKKKDHVDAILVEELREEEANWINYDSDELAVKMQLTDTIFDSLLADTVDTVNRVYAKKKLQRQQTS